MLQPERKAEGIGITKVLAESAVWRGFGREE
jgi:hypothetical protein